MVATVSIQKLSIKVVSALSLLTDSPDMRENFVIDPLIGKRQQLLLATQLCRMVLKINNVIIAGSDENEF